MEKALSLFMLLTLVLPTGVLAQTSISTQPAAPQPTSVDGFLQIEDIDGENQSDGDPDQPIITGQVANPTTGSATPSGDVKETDAEAAAGVDVGAVETELSDGTSGQRDVANPDTTARTASGYLKIGDIKGESQDTSDGHKDWIIIESWSMGVGGSTDARPAAETAPPPTEVDGFVHVDIEVKPSGGVILKGKKISENNREAARRLLAGGQTDYRGGVNVAVGDITGDGMEADTVPTESISLNFAKIDTQEEFVEYAALLVTADENIKQMELGDGEVILMHYEYPADLFGFLPVTYVAEIEIVVGPAGEEIDSEEYGRVKVKTPWWLLFAQDTGKDVRHELAHVLQQGGDTTVNPPPLNMDNPADPDTMQNNQTDLDFLRMRAALGDVAETAKLLHDTAMSIIRKIGG